MMLDIKGAAQGELLEITTEGTATQDDLHAFKEALKAKTMQEEPLNALFVFKNIQGITPKALLEDIKTLPYVKSIKKAAIVSDGTFSKLDETISSMIPGVEIAQYTIGEINEARSWLQ